MISAIIFSKDRACQLRLLLESIFYNSYKLLDNINIIYTASTPEFAHGYSLLQVESIIPKIKINWLQETKLEDNVLTTLRSYVSKSDKNFIVFLTDDSVFYQIIHQHKFSIESLLHPGSDVGCFTLRMGLNTTEQTYWQLGNNIQLRYAKVGNLLKWRHTDYSPSHGYGYPLSVDGHIFRAPEILNLVQQVVPFAGVNQLEAKLSNLKFEIGPCMASFEQSVLVTVPINRVQQDFQNVSGMYHGISQEELNKHYLAGEIIDYYSINFSDINSTHKELKYTFKRK